MRSTLKLVARKGGCGVLKRILQQVFCQPGGFEATHVHPQEIEERHGKMCLWS